MTHVTPPAPAPPPSARPFRVLVPIGTKMFLMLMVVIGTAVGLVTSTAIRSFNQDKAAYVFDLTSQVARNIARDADRSLVELVEKMHLFAAVLDAPDVGPVEKGRLLRSLFEEFPAFLILSIYEDSASRVQVFNTGKLERRGVTREQLLERRASLGVPVRDVQPGQLVVRNSTLDPRHPTLVLAVPLKSAPGQVLVADVEQERVFHVDSEAAAAPGQERYVAWMVDGQGHLVAHPDVVRAQRGQDVSHLEIVRTMLAPNSYAGTQEFADAHGGRMLGAFARLSVADLGVVVQVPRASAFRAARQLVESAVYAAVGVMALALLAGLMFSRTLTRPLRVLSHATQAIARGHFDADVDVRTRDELGELGASIRTMVADLKTRDAELHQAHAQLIQSEKMAAFGQMSAGFAHEVKNPLAGILGSAQLAKIFSVKGKSIDKFLDTIEIETKRCRDIIDNLLRFARQERAELSLVDVNEVVQSTIALVEHQGAMKRIPIRAQLCADPPPVWGNANQLQQVVTNLVLNAQDAIEGSPPRRAERPAPADDGPPEPGARGAIDVQTRIDDGRVEITVADNGPGVPHELRERVFEPFFTTKPVGSGTGLGLSVSYGIIKGHGGEITVSETPGGGATFHVRLPVHPKAS